jgi:hypothetical protein
MEAAAISDLKNQLSAYLARVRAGASVLILDRDRRNRVTIRRPDDRQHLLFREPRFAHAPSRSGSRSLRIAL